jgi:hypothetical protein
MIEAIAYAIVCFIICKTCSLCDRLKKACKGATLFIALSFSYNTLHPLLPQEIDHLLYTTIWGVLFAYAVPTEQQPKKKSDKEQGDDEDDKKHRSPKIGVEGEIPPTSTLT